MKSGRGCTRVFATARAKSSVSTAPRHELKAEIATMNSTRCQYRAHSTWARKRQRRRSHAPRQMPQIALFLNDQRCFGVKCGVG